MQPVDWNDLRHVLAVAREGSYVAAARRLGFDATTVARRVRVLEAALGARLFVRGTRGELRPTEAGEIALRRAEAVEAEIGGLTAAVQGADAAAASGTVRVTAVPILTSRVLVPAATGLLASHPGLRVELISEARDLNLTRREADIAVRLARPGAEVGDRVVARCVGTLAYAAYATVELRADAAALPWLAYEDGMAWLPQARWIARAGQRAPGLAAVAVNDAEALLQAIRAGLGRSLLPCLVADRARLGPCSRRGAATRAGGLGPDARRPATPSAHQGGARLDRSCHRRTLRQPRRGFGEGRARTLRDGPVRHS